jgi:hypothetical protein
MKTILYIILIIIAANIFVDLDLREIFNVKEDIAPPLDIDVVDRDEFLRLVNEYRLENGITEPIVYDDSLELPAEIQVYDNYINERADSYENGDIPLSSFHTNSNVAYLTLDDRLLKTSINGRCREICWWLNTNTKEFIKNNNVTHYIFNDYIQRPIYRNIILSPVFSSMGISNLFTVRNIYNVIVFKERKPTNTMMGSGDSIPDSTPEGYYIMEW